MPFRCQVYFKDRCILNAPLSDEAKKIAAEAPAPAPLPCAGKEGNTPPSAAAAAAAAAPAASTSTAAASSGDPRFDLLRSVGEECVTEADLKNLLAKKPEFILYDGFEPSGRMHIAQVALGGW